MAISTRFEAINLSTQPGLPAIDATGIQKDRAAHLAVWLIALWLFQDRDGDERAHAPIPSQHARFLFKRRNILRRDFEDEIEHSDAATVIAPDLAQGRSLCGRPLPQIDADWRCKWNCLTPCAPAPFSEAIWRAKFEPEAGLLLFLLRL